MAIRQSENSYHDMVIERLTQSPNWGYEQFREISRQLAMQNKLLPGSKRPDTIDIGIFVQMLEQLSKKHQQFKTEIARPTFIDIDKGNFVFGQTTKGTESSVRVSKKREPGREEFQQKFFSNHIHPIINGPSMHNMGFSGQDYLSLILNPQELGSFMKTGDTIFFALKTNVTPNFDEREYVKKLIGEIRTDYFDKSNKPIIQRVINMNKAMCIELGLVLYMMDAKKDTRMKRTPVAIKIDQ